MNKIFLDIINENKCILDHQTSSICCNDCQNFADAVCRKNFNSFVDRTINLPWLLPYKNGFLPALLKKIQQSMPDHTSIIDFLEKEEIRRLENFARQTGNQTTNLPSPAVLLEKNGACYISCFIQSGQLPDQEGNRSQSCKSFLESVERTRDYLKKEFPTKDIPELGLLHEAVFNENYGVSGDSAMLPYWIQGWYILMGLQVPKGIAATGAIDISELICQVDSSSLQVKLCGALSAGCDRIFYPASQKNELPESLQNNNRLFPIDSLDQMRQHLKLIAPELQAKQKLNQFIEGSRPQSAKKLQKTLATYLCQYHNNRHENWIFKKFNDLLRNNQQQSKNRLLKLARAFFSYIKKSLVENLTNEEFVSKKLSRRFKLSYLEASLPTPAWISILPFILFELHNENDLIGKELYDIHVERFYHHDQPMTIAYRAFEQIHNQIRENYWQNESFRRKHQHLIGMFCFDPIRATSELLSIKKRTPFEQDLLEKLKSVLNDTDPETLAKIGTNRITNHQNYWHGLKIAISRIFTGFNPSKHRHLRYDQRLGSFCRIIFEAQRQNFPIYEIVKNHLEYHFENNPDGQSLLTSNPELNEFLKKESFVSSSGICKLIKIIEENKIPGLMSLGRHLIDLKSKLNAIQPEFFINGSKRTISEKAKFHIKNNFKQSFIDQLSRQIYNRCNNQVFYQPGLHLARLFLRLNRINSSIIDWLKDLETWVTNHENIFCIQGTATTLAFMAGKLFKEMNINFDKTIVESFSGKKVFPLAFLMGMASKSDFEDCDFSKFFPEKLFTMDFSFLFLIDSNHTQKLHQTFVDPYLSSLKKEHERRNFLSILKLSGHLPNEHSFAGKNVDFFKIFPCKEYIRLNSIKRDERKLFFLYNLLEAPAALLKLPFARLDPENISFTTMYCIIDERMKDFHPLLQFKQKLKRILKLSCQKLYDTSIICSIQLIQILAKKDKKKLTKIITSGNLDLQNFILANQILKYLKK